jgi:cytochrome c-type biogenesis protein CcmE
MSEPQPPPQNAPADSSAAPSASPVSSAARLTPEAVRPAVARGGVSTTVKVLLSIAVIAGVVGFFRFSARGHTSHYKMVEEVMVAPSSWVGKPLKVHGFVEPGTIDEKVVDQETVRSFVLEHKGKRILVRNKGPKPDTFKDRSEVVAEGKIVEENGEPVLVATNLMAKCPSKYEGAPKDKLFEQ